MPGAKKKVLLFTLTGIGKSPQNIKMMIGYLLLTKTLSRVKIPGKLKTVMPPREKVNVKLLLIVKASFYSKLLATLEANQVQFWLPLKLRLKDQPLMLTHKKNQN